jgi:hypothetical protein
MDEDTFLPSIRYGYSEIINLLSSYDGEKKNFSQFPLALVRNMLDNSNMYRDH